MQPGGGIKRTCRMTTPYKRLKESCCQGGRPLTHDMDCPDACMRTETRCALGCAISLHMG